MKSLVSGIIAAVALLAFSPCASAETLVFKDGKTLEVENIRTRGDKIYFLLHGVKISASRAEIERIESLDPVNSQTTPGTDEKRLNTQNSSPPVSRETKHPHKESQARPQQKSIAKTRQKQQESVKPKTRIFRLDGFRDLRWGELASDVSGLQILDSENSIPGVEEYIRPNEALKIGRADIESIIYGFWQDRLYTVTIWTEGRSDYLRLKQTVFNEFGSGFKSDKSRENYVWSDNKADRMLEYTKTKKYGMFWMRSRKLDRQYNLAQLKRPASYLKRKKP